MRLAPVTPLCASLFLVLSGAAVAQEPQSQAEPRARAVRPTPVIPARATTPVPSARLEIAPAEATYRVYERQVERAEKEVATLERRIQELRAKDFLVQNRALPAGDREALEREVREREEQLRTAQKALNEARSRLIQERVRSATRSTPLNTPFFYVQGHTATLSPEMARKTAGVMALRSIVQLGLTRAEIEAALPSLRQLQESAKALEAQSTQALDEERAALLAAKPGEVPSSTTTSRLREASNRYREEQQQAWDALAKAVGSEKATGLRRLLGESGTLRVLSAPVPGSGSAPSPRVFGELLTLSEPNLVAPAIAVAGTGTNITMFRGSAISLSELIDLLTQRAAALKEQGASSHKPPVACA